jgi:hypothetical protein
MNTGKEVQFEDRAAPSGGSGYPRVEPVPSPVAEHPQTVRLGADRGYYPEDPRIKSPVLAMVLSLMPGLGQVYLGYYQHGFVNILVVASIIAALNHGVPGYMEPLLGVFLAFFWLYNMVDAGRRASFYNQALAGLGPMEMPGDLKIYEGRGTIAGGITLIAVGSVFFAHTRFGVSLAWLEQWWPLALVLMGVYLLYKALREPKKEVKAS